MINKNFTPDYILIEGPEKSGKSHAIALIGKHLKSLGCDVTIQAEETHNASKLAKEDEELLERLRKMKIVIKERKKKEGVNNFV